MEFRGFAFVEFYSADDAAEAHDKLDHAKLAGREIAIVFAKDKRKTPGEMRGGRDVGPRGIKLAPFYMSDQSHSCNARLICPAFRWRRRRRRW